MPTIRDLAFIGCRLISLLILYLAFVHLQPVIFAALVRLGLASYSSPSLGVLPSLVLVGIDIVVALFFWKGANGISKVMVQDGKHGETPGGDEMEPWSPDRFIAAAIAFFGLYLVIVNLPTLVIQLYYTIFENFGSSAALAHVVMMVTLGGYCLVGSASVMRFIVSMRRWR